MLARGVSQDAAYQCWSNGIEEIARAEADARTDDEAFWQCAPQLSGAWPDAWRRGFVYDLETLRMVMRPPAGVIPTAWTGCKFKRRGQYWQKRPWVHFSSAMPILLSRLR